VTLSPRVGRLSRLASLFLLAGTPALAPAAQEEPIPSGLVEEVEVHLVTLPILATDKKGRPVADLKAGEVTIVDAGEERKVAFLDPFRTKDSAMPPLGVEEVELTASPEPAAGPLPPPPPSIRRVVFLFDARSSRIPNRLKWAAAARKWVADEMEKGDLVSIALVDGDIRTILPFTADRNQIEQMLRDPYYLKERNMDRRAQVSELMDMLTTCDRSYDQVHCAMTAVEPFVFQWEQESRQIIDGLKRYTAALGAVPGRKMILYGSEGFIRDIGNLAVNCILAEFGTDKMDMRGLRTAMKNELSLELMRMYSVAAAAETAFFALDTRSISDRDWVSDAGEALQLHERAVFNPMAEAFDESRAVLTAVSESTGGRAYFGGDAPKRLSEAIGSSRGLYTVGYYAPRNLDPTRKVKIKVRRRSVRVSDPTGASAARPPRPLPSQIAVLPVEPAPSGLAVPLAVEIDLRAIPFEKSGRETWTTQLAVYAALLDPSGRLAGENLELVDVTLGESEFHTRDERPFRHVLRVSVPAGHYRARVRVTDRDFTVRSDRVLPRPVPIGVAPAPEEAGESEGAGAS
jgi:VWFA-related protein